MARRRVLPTMLPRAPTILPRVPAIEWVGGPDGHAAVLDQTLLPGKVKVLRVTGHEVMRGAIRRLAVRGAPAIGIAEDPVTGNASGLGRHIAEAVLAWGDYHVATARNPRRLCDPEWIRMRRPKGVLVEVHR